MPTKYPKRRNALQVLAEAVRWGKRGARVNTISPGILFTPMAKEELTGPRGEGYRRMIELCPAGRGGTPDEGRNRWGAPDRTRRRIHHRQRLPHGRRTHRRLPVWRTRAVAGGIDSHSARSAYHALGDLISTAGCARRTTGIGRART